MPKMPSCTLFCASHHTNTPFKEHFKVLIWTVLKIVLLLLNKGLKFRKELFNQIEVWQIEWQVQELNACFSTHPLNSFAMVEGCIIHDQHRLWVWVWLTVMK